MKGNSRGRLDFSAVDLPSPRPQSHSPHPGPVGSQVSSPAHHLLPRPHLNPHLSHPDLTSPRRGMSPVEYNLAALAPISGVMERPKSSGLSGSSSSVGGAGTGAFTLAHLISNVGGEHEGETEVRWSEDQSEVHHGQQGLALSNLAAPGKLEDMERLGMSRGSWPPSDPNLPLPLDRDRDGLTMSHPNVTREGMPFVEYNLASSQEILPSSQPPRKVIKNQGKMIIFL